MPSPGPRRLAKLIGRDGGELAYLAVSDGLFRPQLFLRGVRLLFGARKEGTSRPCNWTESPIHSAGDQPVTLTAVTARFALKPEGTSADRGFRAGRPGGGVAAQYRDGSA
jgi:hypothetical protein